MALHDPFDTIEEAFFRKWFANANFDPTGGLLTAGMMAAGAGVSAFSTIAGGGAAAKIGQAQQQAAEFTAEQQTSNAAGEIAGASRSSIDIQQKANLLRSTSVANAAAGGVVTTSGSPLTNESQIVSRGRNEAALAMWNGENKATGLLNEAAAARTTGALEAATGQYQQQASYLSAAGTLAGAGGSMFKLFGSKSAPGLGPGFPATN
jgi:hypothetical protein